MLKSKSNRNCCVPQCTARASKNPSLSFHKFPSEEEIVKVKDTVLNRRRLWILRLRIGKPVSTSMLVCSNHFKTSDYLLSNSSIKRPTLKKTAIPSLCIPQVAADYTASVIKRGRNTLYKYKRRCMSFSRLLRQEDIFSKSSANWRENDTSRSDVNPLHNNVKLSLPYLVKDKFPASNDFGNVKSNQLMKGLVENDSQLSPSVAASSLSTSLPSQSRHQSERLRSVAVQTLNMRAPFKCSGELCETILSNCTSPSTEPEFETLEEAKTCYDIRLKILQRKHEKYQKDLQMAKERTIMYRRRLTDVQKTNARQVKSMEHLKEVVNNLKHKYLNIETYNSSDELDDLDVDQLCEDDHFDNDMK